DRRAGHARPGHLCRMGGLLPRGARAPPRRPAGADLRRPGRRAHGGAHPALREARARPVDVAARGPGDGPVVETGGVQILEATEISGVRSAVLLFRHPVTPLCFELYPMVHAGEASFFLAVEERL